MAQLYKTNGCFGSINRVDNALAADRADGAPSLVETRAYLSCEGLLACVAHYTSISGERFVM